jgi:hypothetical protein
MSSGIETDAFPPQIHKHPGKCVIQLSGCLRICGVAPLKEKYLFHNDFLLVSNEIILSEAKDLMRQPVLSGFRKKIMHSSQTFP